MPIELARAQALPKPWGILDLRPWSSAANDSSRLIGEIWYERPGNAASDPSLLLKLLFTSQPLSIQVHPDDAYAQSMGLARGKTEAWYILSAAPGAKIALGLKKRLALRQLHAAVDDGSIAGLVAWQTVLPGDVVFVPAGTIHAIGAGLVIAEIQQRSDATFRMFDFGRKRDLHAANAIAVADRGPSVAGLKPKRLTDERTLLVCDTHFAFERVELAPDALLHLEAERETWLLVVRGSARTGSFGVTMGDAVFAQSDRVDIQAGPDGMVCLVAYTGAGGPVPHLLQRPARPSTTDTAAAWKMQGPTTLTPTEAPPTDGHVGARL
jgi:mannose-6-phosphate isomerase